MQRNARVDRNQSEIVKQLRSYGATVLITSQLKNAFDILVGYKSKLFIMEIKDPLQPPSKRRMTEGEKKCEDSFLKVDVPYYIILSAGEAIKIIESEL